MVDIDNPSSYKNCQKKQYEIWACKPPINTIVINKFDQHDTLVDMKAKTLTKYANKCCITAAEVEELKNSNPQVLNYLMSLVQQGKVYVVTKNTPIVLCGTMGEMWTVDLNIFNNTYTVQSNVNLQSVEDIDWFRVKSKSAVACSEIFKELVSATVWMISP